MTSSMLAGERRWASARRGGMTVLGKVAVPKPINLPSQRLENHGLDPNVDIVPKGSLSWGSRPSSSASNPWGSSVPSLSGDCPNGSPSHAGGRPSSGGSGTRPSTAGSDRMHEPVPTARGSNSRPSSASGVLTSNQTPLAPLRPQSAETRPGSSNLSRFAEHIPDSSGAWGSTGNADKMIVASTKSDGFSLSSGDFPTLGSEKDISGKKPDSHEYGSHDRPRSSSDSAAAADDGTIPSESGMKGGNAHTWKRDESQHMEDGADHNSNNWHGGYPQQFLNTNVPPQHFDAWRGPPVNSPAGVWYRGPPGGPPYGPHVPPGGFPLEPFPYYRPHMPPHALGNSQPVPQHVPVGGPRGHHPKSGEPFRPQIPDGYMHPGMPVRPGFYPRPVPYDNYFGAPMGYNPNERDIPFMGMPAAPPVFNRYPAQNGPDRSNTHTKAGRRGPNATNSPLEQVESGNSDRGPYKVLMKQHNDLDAQGDEGSWENTSPGNVSFPETGGQPSATFRKNEWGTEGRRQEMNSRRPAFSDYSASRKFDNRGHPVQTARVMSPERIDHFDRDWGKKSDTASAMSPFPDAVHVPKHSALLQKIEGLNAKARASDSRRDPASASFREEQHDVAQYDAISKTCKNDVGTATLCAERPNSRDSIHSSGEGPVSRGHMIHQSNAAIINSRRANNGAESQFEHRGKGRSNTDADGWRKKPNVTECGTAIPTTNVVPIPIGHNQDNHIHAEVYATTEPSFPANNDGDSSTQIHDTIDTQAQRAKMRELAKQRAIQLQKEEEERIKEQKAKALAKLEELNRRSQSGDVLTEKSEKTPPHSGMIVSQEEWQIPAEPVKYALESEEPNQIMTSSSDIVGSAIESCTSRVAESTVLSKNMHTDTSDISEQVTAAPLSSPLKQDSSGAGAGDVKAVVRGNDSSCSTKHKHTGYKSIQNIQVEHQFAESLISFGTIGLTNIHGSGAVEGTAFSETVSEAILPGPKSTIPENSNTVRELSAAQKKKSTNTGKNKNKPESPLPVSDLQVQVSRHPDFSKMESSQSKVDPGSVQAMEEDLERLAGQHSVISEESQVKVNNYLKSQPPRRMSRNGQITKVADKSHGNDAATWAPVRSHHRTEAEDGADLKAVPDSVAVSAKSSGNFVHNSGKSKRAEMERYVPKPVAKELAQQGTVQQSSSVAQNTLNETVGGRESSFQESSQATRSVVENVRPTVESNTGVSKQGKQTKAHGGWKQRGSTESSRVHMGSSSNSSTNHNNMDQQESFIPEEHQVIAETNVSHVWDPSDGWNMPEEPTAAVNVSFGVKDQVVVKGKGKRQPYKGHKIISSKIDVDQKNSNGGEMYKKPIQSPSLEISQPERTIAAKENRGSGERSSSLWQPKLQVYTANAQTGSRSGGGQHVSPEAGWGTKEDYSPVIRDASATLNEDHTEVIPQTHTGHLQSKNKSVRQSTNVVHQGRREKKVASDKEPPQPYHKHGLGGMDEQAPPESGDTYYEQRTSSGFRKHGNQNNRSGRVQEPREDWSSLEQDARHRNVPGNRERQQRNSHYEYQPVRSHNYNKSNNFEGPDASQDMSSRYRERGQGQSRRGGGNSYGRKSGAVQVDAD